MINVLLFILVIPIIQECSCARILAIAPIPSYSHQLFFRPIWKELSKRGHQLTLLTTDPMVNPPPNMRQIDWNSAYEVRHNKHKVTKVAQENEYNLPKILASYQAMLNDVVDQELSHPDVQMLLKNESEHFDLLMVEYHHSVLYAFSERFKCPYIGISSMEIANYYHKTLGNPVHPVLYPEVILPFERDLSFTERLLSTLYIIYDIYRRLSYTNAVENEMARKYFGENLPPLTNILRNVSMVFLNIHPVFNVRPLGPGFVSIGGGTHMEVPKPLPKESSCARILAIVPVPSYSHQLFFRPIWKELSKRGHQLTLLTTDPMASPPPNIVQIDWSSAYDLRHNKHNITKVVQENEYNIPKILASYEAMLNDIVDQELSHPDVQMLLKNESEQFDLLMVEYHHNVLYAFSERFKCPYIGISSMEIANYYHKALGNPIHPVLYPEVLLPFERDLSFKERLLSTIYVIYGIYRKLSYTNAVENEMARKYFGENLPPLRNILRNVSMVFLNINPVFNVRPLGPGFVSIGGGTHMKKPKPLPKYLKQFLDNASEGVIYFSLGTNVRSHHLSSHFIKAAVDAFRELPYTVLWRFETDIPEKSSNVKIVKWLPQQDILRHENVKLFITQCGIQSMEESILSHVPLLAIPFVSDQKMNSIKIVNKGIGLTIDKNTITKEILIQTIQEIMNNSSYRINIRKISDLMQDQPMSGLDKAIWWTEYVIRHKGVKHFWHPNMDLPTYQFLLLDVISFLAAIVLIIMYILYKMLKFVLCTLLLQKNIETKQKIN